MTDTIFAGCEGIHKLMDNMLIEAPSVDILKERMKEVFKIAQGNGVTFSRNKIQVGRKVKFRGF